MAEQRNHHILMRYRGATEDRERSLSSGAHAVEDFLGQFEGDDLAEASMRIALALGRTVHDRLGEAGGSFRAAIDKDRTAMEDIVHGAEGLQWLAGVAGAAADSLSRIEGLDR